MEDISRFGFTLAHMGVNAKEEPAAHQAAKRFEELFGFTVIDNGKAYFSANHVEWMRRTAYGTAGHIGIGTTDVEGAKAYLEAKGVTFIAESAVYDENGRMTLIYLEEEHQGFAVHLILKPTE